MRYCFGVDVGGTSIKAGLLQEDGTIVDKWEIDTRKENHGEAILPDIAKLVGEKYVEAGLNKEDIVGIGIGVPAPVDEEGIVHNTANLGWGYKEVKKELEELTGFPVEVGNDANMAALGEMWLGAGRGNRNMVMVTLGTGVGGGVIIGGRPLVGTNGAGGEIGHILANRQETDKCGCGKKGCLEQYASATGIVRMAKQRLAGTADETALRTAEPLTAKDIFDAAKAGDAIADEIVEEMTKILGGALADIACIVNPEVFVIGGGVSKAGSIITDRVKKYFNDKTFHACRDAYFELATLGNDAGMYGCVQMVLE